MTTQNVAFSDWTRPLGEPGDLADIIVATLSLASELGAKKVSRPDFYEIFSQLGTEFPDVFPPMIFTRTGDYLYSKTLGSALEQALRSGLEVMNPRFFYFGVLTPEDAARNVDLIKGNLDLIKQNTGEAFIGRLRLVAKRFAALAAERVCS